MPSYDVVVVGGGAAGMTAALYALRNGKTVLVIEKEGFGGQITHSPKVENIPGFLSIQGLWVKTWKNKRFIPRAKLRSSNGLIMAGVSSHTPRTSVNPSA